MRSCKGMISSSQAITNATEQYAGLAEALDRSASLVQLRVRQAFAQPLGADAAGEALAARFLGEEGHGAVGDLHHVAAVVEHHDPPGAEERALAADVGLVEGYLQVLAGQAAVPDLLPPV